jgi:hypothetical protein
VNRFFKAMSWYGSGRVRLVRDGEPVRLRYDVDRVLLGVESREDGEVSMGKAELARVRILEEWVRLLVERGRDECKEG